ncbi:PfkB family carbohydrate kinase [Sanyastnella coralliicola]|uniref:PfkB family carbohydrate kinase n=1 Tax=Sanyastnella coralliicola TaxID=3069118 RepID=UPI0027B95014|nr:PfkB family carbohydrate kinase [Longitalea sp. SCSIO 12813]
MSLIAVGTVAFDAIETPFGKTDKVVGGAATYITLAASYFVKHSELISVVGDDFPSAFLADMKARGIAQGGLQIKEGEKSFFWSGKYHYDMNSRDTLDTQLNVLADFQPVVPEEAKGAEYVMLGNLDPTVQMSVIDQMPKRPKLVVLDTMNFWMDIAMDKLAAVIAKVDVLTINDEEARQLTGEHSLVKAAQKILTMGPRYLIIKKGEHGALLFDEEKVFFAPALPLEDVVDPTGAGDTFAGGFIGYLAHTDDISFQNMKRAVIIGSAMASFTCEAFGPERLMSLTTNEIDHRIQKFVDLVDFDIVLVE